MRNIFAISYAVLLVSCAEKGSDESGAPFGVSRENYPERKISSPDVEERIVRSAQESELYSHVWRTMNPSGGSKCMPGYLEGMALMYASYRSALFYDRGDPFINYATMPVSPSGRGDALLKYEWRFKQWGLDIRESRLDRLTAVFALLIELGERESDGGFDIGWDSGPFKPKSEQERIHLNTPAVQIDIAKTAEAGIFQSSWNYSDGRPLVAQLLDSYQFGLRRSRFPFKEHFTASRYGEKNKEEIGSGRGVDFQRIAKAEPSFAVEYAAMTIRTPGVGGYFYLLKDKMELPAKTIDFLRRIDKASSRRVW